MLYEVVCKDCGNKEERLCKVEERHNQKCNKCGGDMKLMISLVYSQWTTECPTASKGKMIK
jgi:predicted nucleic acid-binding Zn ribbon protein